MKRAAAILALGLALLTGAACGKKGPLQPPLSAGPKPVEGLTARQRAGTVILGWANPEKAVDGRPVGTLEAVEVWVFDQGLPAGARPGREADVERAARLARRIPRSEFASFQGPAEGPTRRMAFPFVFEPVPEGPKALAFTVRVFDGKRRASEFASPVAVSVRLCPGPPVMVEARVLPDRVEIEWGSPSANTDGTRPGSVGGYAVYRLEGTEPERRLGTTAADVTRYEDRDFRFGRTYRYFVRALAPGPGDEVESGDSAAAEAVARDVFPPDPPAGLVAIPAPDAVSLSWQAGREEDLAGYRVWRKEAGASAYVPLTTGLLAANAFTDATAAKGKTYAYAVSAVDKDGNESAKAESGPVGLKEGGA